MKGDRIPRVEEAIKREISELLRDEVKDRRIGGLISITDVKVTKDLGIAKVFYSLLAREPGQEEQVQEGLTSASGYLRGEIARRLNLRKAPHIRFLPDHTIEEAVKVSALINQAIAQDRKNHQ